ncbi:MAG: cobalamin biosynthesis protein CobW [Oscillibacter sp.]|nr:cobalamin biosynthesis protein CobW [Oscillibacter sp.]
MTKVNVISGFLGAGKTTLIKKLLDEALKGEKIVLIENEFGEIGIDGGFLKDAGVEISEMNSGCICCSLVGDFGEALKKVMEQFHPDRILIEPSGVGKLSDVIRAVQDVAEQVPEMALGCAVTVADASKAKVYMKNFGEFYANQVQYAGAIILSRTQKLDGEKLEAAVALLREKNEKAPIVTTPWDQLTGAQLLSAMENGNTLAADLLAEEEDDVCPVCGEHHHDHDHEEHEHHHHHDHEHEEHEHHHDHECCHHHDHEEHDHEHHHEDHDHAHEHHHHHDHDECGCGHDHHHHHHHHGHDADEVFTSWGVETTHTFTAEKLESILTELDSEKYGAVLRAKGIVPTGDGTWLHFDYVPEEHQVRTGPADYTGRLCVIGGKLDEAGLKALFEV